MDKFDQNLIKELIRNARKPFLKISKKIGISPSTVEKRFHNLKKNGAILGTFIIIDLSKIGFEGKAFLFVTATKDYDEESTIKSILNIPNVFFISENVGTFDLLVILVFRNLKEIKEKINKVRALSGVEKVEVAFTDEVLFPVRLEYTEINYGS